MRSLVYLFLFSVLRFVQAISSPDIYSFVQPDVATPGLGDASLPALVPSTSRHGSGPSSGLNIFLPDYKVDPNWLPLVNSLKSIGLQIKVQQTLTISTQCRTLLIYTSPSVEYRPAQADIDRLALFVRTGGRLIFMNQVPTSLQFLAGVTASKIDTAGKRSILQLSKANVSAEAVRGFDFANYYDIAMPFYDNDTSTGLVNVGYTPASGAVVLGNYLVRANRKDSLDTSATNAAFVVNQPSNSTGYVYSFGVDLGWLYQAVHAESGDYYQQYDGKFYPGYDIGTRIIKNIATSSQHWVSLWSVPYNKGIAFTTTWDIDTYVSYPHGQGIAAAALERGAAGNLNLHTKYISDAYETAYFQYGVPYIYQITGHRIGPDGYPFIDFGTHTVSHSPNAVQFPSGTGKERYLNGAAPGYTPTIRQCEGNEGTPPNNGQTCIQGGTSGLSFWTEGGSASGEVRVSAYLIRHIMNDIFKTNYNLTTYRPGHLAMNKYQANHCVANGFIGGSSCSGNSHLTHLPFQVGHNREPFQELPYFEFPLQWSDGDGNMSSADFPGSDFRMQVNDLHTMSKYGGHYNILLHPSDAVLDKIQIQRALHDAARPFAAFFNQTGIANWWTIRDRAVVDITETTQTSVTMTVRLDGPVEGLTLQVPRNYVVGSASAPLTVCQQPSYDNFTNAVVLRNTAKGLHTLKFSLSSQGSSVNTCPDFTPKPQEECVAWDVAVDDFLELFFYNANINLLLLKTSSTGLATNHVNGTLQLTATAENGVNNYYTEVSRFCFDATVYTHVFFDMVAPVGSTFYVQLVSYDAGCNNEITSPTYLDVTKYAIADGKNHTVSIPLSDFAGQDLKMVKGLRLGNIAPAQTPVYIDNIKIQKRCFSAPGEDRTEGLTIDSFQNVDRWIEGVNSVFGKTDYDNSMTFAKLSELGKMQLLPSSPSSYIYSSTVRDGKKLNATGYNSLSINVRGPVGGSFDIVATSGTQDKNATVSTKTYASLSQSAYSNITVPLSSFSGLDINTISKITLKNFAPYGGSGASNFTVRWISLLGNGTGNSGSSCSGASGYVVFDFCDENQFKKQTSALGTPLSDDNTMTHYNQTEAGYINMVPKASDSYFYSLLADQGKCATVNSTYKGVVLTVSGTQGATADVGFKHGGATCNTNVITSLVPVTFTAAPTKITIPFSRFPSGFNQNNLQSFVMANFNKPGSTYRIHSLVFQAESDIRGCSLCEGTLVNTCSFTSTVPRTNQLSGGVTDEGTMSSYTVASDGSLSMVTSADAYWYSEFGDNQCYNAAASNATALQISVAAPAGTTFSIDMRYATDDKCAMISAPVSVPITNYITFAGSSSYQVARIPFADFPGLNSSRLSTVAISRFSGNKAEVKIGCISLVSAATTPTTGTCSCPDTAWLNYCSTGAADRNANGGVQSDDSTMKSKPAIVNNGLSLQPASAQSYWYSLLNCVDVSNSTTLYLNVTAKAGTSFNVKLESCGTDRPGASLSSSTYGAMTGKPVTLAIPLSAYTSKNSAVSLKSINSVVLEAFSDSTATYSLNCAYFGASGAKSISAISSTDSALDSASTSPSTTASSTTVSSSDAATSTTAAESAASESADAGSLVDPEPVGPATDAPAAAPAGRDADAAPAASTDDSNPGPGAGPNPSTPKAEPIHFEIGGIDVIFGPVSPRLQFGPITLLKRDDNATFVDEIARRQFMANF